MKNMYSFTKRATNHARTLFPFKTSLHFVLGLLFLFLGFSHVLGQTTYKTGTGTFTVPANVTHINAAAWGGGGGGSSSSGSGGNGGGGGGAASYNLISVVPGNTFTYAVGIGGAGGEAAGRTGADGVISTINSVTPITPAIVLSGGPGTGGLGNSAAINTPTNSGGGIATGSVGAILSNGLVGTSNGNPGGNGGNSGTAFTIFGAGGAGSSNSVGNPGNAPGAGGGGGERYNGWFSSSNYAGGAGAAGRVFFDYITVTGITPNPVCVGSTITITGTNFSTSGTTTVTINGVACTSVTEVSATSITAVVAAGTTSGVVNIVNNGRRNNGHSITVNAAPATPGNPTSNSPQCNPPGVTLTRAGTPPAGVDWYWQTTAAGTSTTNNTATFLATTSGTYYIRARNTAGCWSTDSGSLVVSVSAGLPAIATTPIPANSATGVCYQGFNSVNSIRWNAVPGATSYDVYFGAGAIPVTLTANVTTNSYSTGTLAANTIYWWRIVPRNACGPTSGTPSAWSFTTAATPCTATVTCTPTITTPTDLFINSFQFVGTLNDAGGPNLSGAGTSGYSNFTGLAHIVRQPQGSVLNIVAKAIKADLSPTPGYWKAWVDYNRDGDFADAGEEVYRLMAYTTESLTFGFVIPPTTPVGMYRFRIRVGNTNSFDSCTNLSRGETEDYIFEVIANCSAKVNTVGLSDVARCGTGTVTLSATSVETGPGTGVRWYTTATGGTPVFDGENFVTPVITENTRTTYYVVAYNGGCESVFRIPVTAIANPGPDVHFTATPAFCAPTTSGQLISAENGKRLDVLLNEQFNGGLGTFTQSSETGYTNIPNTNWISRSSPYIPPMPPYEGLAPALSSGYTGGDFVMSNTDFARTTSVLNRLTSGSLNTQNFDNLKLEFDLYYFTLITADTDPDPNLINYFSVDYTLDGSVATPTWVNLQTMTTNQGNPNIWRKLSIDLPAAVLNRTNVKVRFSSYAYGKGSPTLFKESIAALDNVKISGIKDESSQFNWSSSVSGILFESNCTTPLGTNKAATVCVKPSPTQFEDNGQFVITASASFSNGCPAVGTLTIANDLKVWDTTLATDWANAPSWKPDNIVPDANKCVIIKKPVIINPGSHGLAKNITITTGGKLNIFGSLTVTDAIINNVPAADVVVESDGNLIQVNEGVNINTGSVTAKRTLNLSTGRLEYNYLISPLEGQTLKDIYTAAGAVAPVVLYHNETSNRFSASSGAYIKGRGLAVKEPTTAFVPTTLNTTFTGKPTNGAFTYNVVNSNPTDTNRGYNLVGNPYPSNIDMLTFYTVNGGASGNLFSTAYFWDNKANNKTIQYGDAYGGQSYGILNLVSGAGTAGTGDIALTKTPTRYVKTGQAFMVKSKVAAAAITFNNTMRTYQSGATSFFGKNTVEGETPTDRYWLNMITPENIAAQIAVVYFAEGNNGFTADDSRVMGGSDAVYSIVEGEKVAINGRSSFVNTDVIALGSQHFAAGNYTIALGAKEGLFAEGQNIYLRDKQTSTVTNLSQGNYTFAATAGESSGRFELVYLPEIYLVTDATQKEELVVYKEGTDLVVKAAAKKITALEMVDSSGRLLLKIQPNNTRVVIPAGHMTNGVYILKINQGGKVSTKKVMK
ncbi:GEVED domain-containing protein [Kaistella yonginensis]|uniref:Ig-like domain-containing protein n=1 Tax=Kaistella yonginensis TaxID=658267 RepID=UPI0025B3D0C8|nr:GEVED domain-containing protein [Kaistella yonginensis]MDN3606539.1 GEVED domain-containing protein [Kaistella yonginensis]